MKYGFVKNFIDGHWAESSSESYFDIVSPLDGRLLGRVYESGPDELGAAVSSARRAFPSWSRLPVKERVQVFFRFKALLQEHLDELSNLICEENGKTKGEAVAEIYKCIELSEFATSLPQLMGGEVLEVSRGVGCISERVPLGIVASIVPFNFPAMVPCWTIPNAIALGNCLIVKPSEKVPLTVCRIAELLTLSGLPEGVFNVVHGGRATVNGICDHPEITAVSFVGSTRVAKHVYIRATSNLKRCLALGGAKNHIVVLPDAIPRMAAKNITASMSGCAGQRCMAAGAMVAVGNADHIIDMICEEAQAILPGKDVGAVINKEAKERIESYITEAEREGAKVLVDGRNCSVPGMEKGTYVGPTVIDHVSPDMRIAREEVFGPVICIMRAKSIDEAIAIENSSPYGNAASVFTQDGGMANYFREHAAAGMVGINVGVPVPREPFGFGGWNESKFGVCDITGKSSIEFWTKWKKSTVKWNMEAGVNWMS